MLLERFFSRQPAGLVITPEQGSAFAKGIADDFNPLHDPDSKRFCVPGDLLFSLTLHEQGLWQDMSFKFTGMVGKEASLHFARTDDTHLQLLDTQDKAMLEVSHSGAHNHDLALIERFARAYVAFSGHSFPHILVPLMQAQGVMINTEKPMVVYESMRFHFDHLNVSQPELALTDSQLDVNGKRGQVTLTFDILQDGSAVGQGQKSFLLGGLRDYNDAAMQALVACYQQSKQLKQVRV